GNNPKNIGRIFDIFDDGSKGSVDYSQWLGQEQTLSETPVSWLLDPVNNAVFKGGTITIHGVAASRPDITQVEVSTDGGQTWQIATGTSLWSYEWMVPADGTYVLKSRVVTESGVETPGSGHTVTADSNLPTTTGALTDDETWSGEVVLTGDVTVPEGMTLTVEPGTTIRFQALADDQSAGADASRAELVVAGSFIAIGTEASPITFTSSSTTPAKGDWGGIRMAGNGTLTLDHTVIEYGLLGIAYNSDNGFSEVRISNSTVRYTAGVGISIYVHSGTARTVTLTNNHVHDHDNLGIYLQSSGINTVLTGTVTGNEVHNTGA
ncbi:MAG: right-handed parallel beta-helix repeat-containing protein, partial [Desulfobulbaceae bacterium]|nr:right-handed parallel beta-helix repeat-containing protein [Desulfobulbaceae bacterium]